MRYNNLCTFPTERTLVTFPYVWWDDTFTEAEINQISAFCSSTGEKMQSETFGGYQPDVRRSTISDHKWTQESGWMFDRFIERLQNINNRWYGFALNGFESFQYGEYFAETNDHFDWHLDMHLGNENIPPNVVEPRKLSMTLLMNEPGEDFEGGDFELLYGTEPQPVAMKKGRMIAFPSWMMHRVKPVTRGVRKSVVIWVTGPKFT